MTRDDHFGALPLWRFLQLPHLSSALPIELQQQALVSSAFWLRATTSPVRCTFRDLVRYCSTLRCFYMQRHLSLVDATGSSIDDSAHPFALRNVAHDAHHHHHHSNHHYQLLEDNAIPMPSMSLHAMGLRVLENDADIAKAAHATFRQLVEASQLRPHSTLPDRDAVRSTNSASISPSTYRLFISTLAHKFSGCLPFDHVILDYVGGRSGAMVEHSPSNAITGAIVSDGPVPTNDGSGDPDIEAAAAPPRRNSLETKLVSVLAEGEWLSLRSSSRGITEDQFVGRLLDIVLLANSDRFAYVVPLKENALDFLHTVVRDAVAHCCDPSAKSVSPLPFMTSQKHGALSVYVERSSVARSPAQQGVFPQRTSGTAAMRSRVHAAGHSGLVVGTGAAGHLPPWLTHLLLDEMKSPHPQSRGDEAAQSIRALNSGTITQLHPFTPHQGQLVPLELLQSTRERARRIVKPRRTKSSNASSSGPLQPKAGPLVGIDSAVALHRINFAAQRLHDKTPMGRRIRLAELFPMSK